MASQSMGATMDDDAQQFDISKALSRAAKQINKNVDRRIKELEQSVRKIERGGYQQLAAYSDLRAILGDHVYIPPLRPTVKGIRNFAGHGPFCVAPIGHPPP
jgi:hypothetical protein